MALKYPCVKGVGPVSANFARGGDCITTKSRFLKTPNVFTTSIERQDYGKTGKGGELSKMSGESKSEKAIKPRD
jgi:hypothetical protein